MHETAHGCTTPRTGRALTTSIGNESQTAAPATAPASPSSAKMPAPIIEPMPSTVDPRTVRAFFGCAVAPVSAVLTP